MWQGIPAQIKTAWRQDGPGTLTAGFICLLLLGLPLIFGPAGYHNITAVKHGFLLAASLAYFAALAVLLLIRWWRAGRPALAPRSLWHGASLPQKLILLYALLCVISALASPYPELVWAGSGRYEGLATTFVYIGIFLAVASFGRFYPAYFFALLLALVLNCLVAWLQLGGGNPLMLYPGGYDYYDGNTAYSGQFLGTIGNSGLLAAFFCLAVPALLCYFLRRPREWQSWLFLAGALLGLYILLRSQIAAGMVGLLGAALIIAPRLPRRRRRWLVLALVLLLLLALLLLLFYNGPQQGLLYEASALLHGNVEPGFGSGRLQIWQQTLALIPERPWLGGGPDTLGTRLDLVFTSSDLNAPLRQTRVDTAHNDYLNIAVNIGLLALAVYLAALFATLASWLRRAANPALLAVGAGVFCYSIQIFFSFSLCITAPIFWLLWGLLVAELRQEKQDR
jgi:O-antigen ligase